MQFDFNINGVSVFGAPLPLSSEIEEGYSFWLPVGMREVAPVRQQEFIAGRYCAVQAAKLIGLEILKIPSAVTREPVWPDGITGSISHSKQMAISCISKTDDLLSVGIDAEELIKPEMAVDVEKTIATSEELAYLNSFNSSIGLTLLFSAKEALYKALFPIVRSFIDFKEVKLTKLDLEAGTFELEVISKNPKLAVCLGIYIGSFKKINDTVVTIVSIPKSFKGLHAYS